MICSRTKSRHQTTTSLRTPLPLPTMTTTFLLHRRLHHQERVLLSEVDHPVPSKRLEPTTTITPITIAMEVEVAGEATITIKPDLKADQLKQQHQHQQNPPPPTPPPYSSHLPHKMRPSYPQKKPHNRNLPPIASLPSVATAQQLAPPNQPSAPKPNSQS
jgi:hypothetical protein